MLTLGYISKFPAAYKDREKSVKDVVFTDIRQDLADKKIIIHARTNKYQQEMEIQGETIHLKSPVKVSCSCESFKFEFSHAIFRAGSLLNSIYFIRSIIQRPKEKNPYNTPSGCKHIVALSRQVIKLKKGVKKQ